MKRNHTQETSILHRVLYCVCQLENCGDDEFMMAMRPHADQAFPSQEDESERVVLFSTN